MAYTSKIRALDAICRSCGGSGGHRRVVRALNEWCGLVGGAGGHVRNVRALDEILRPPRRGVGAFPGAPRAQRDLRAARRRGRPPPQPRRPRRDRRHPRGVRGGVERGPGAPVRRRRQPVRRRPAGDATLRQRLRAAPLFRAQPRRLGAARQGRARRAAPTSSRPAARRCSSGSTPTSRASWQAMADSANPVVVVHLGTHSLPGVPLAEIQDQAGTIIGALTGAGARVLWLLENPRSGRSALGPANEQKRLDYNAWLVAQESAHGGLFRTLDYLAGLHRRRHGHGRHRAPRSAARRPARHPGRRLHQGGGRSSA